MIEAPMTKKYYKPLSYTALKNMMFEHDLVDPWRQHNIGQEYFSYRRWNQTAKSRIDFELLNNAAYSLLHNTSYSQNPILDTDHDIFNISLQLNKFKKGKGFYKVRNNLYQDPDFIAKVNQMIDDTLVNTRSSPEDTLEHILFNTQTIARKHTQFKNCLKKSVKTFLEDQ